MSAAGFQPKKPADALKTTGDPQQRKQLVAKSLVLREYRQRLKDYIKSLRENFSEIVKLARVEDETQVSRATHHEQECFQMEVRAANMAKAAENLMKLVSDIKEFHILNDFASINKSISEINTQNQQLISEAQERLQALREDAVADLFDIEQEYYSCVPYQTYHQ